MHQNPHSANCISNQQRKTGTPLQSKRKIQKEVTGRRPPHDATNIIRQLQPVGEMFLLDMLSGSKQEDMQ